MAEYIVELPTEKVPLDRMCFPTDKITGELVRCKDCKWLLEHDNGEWECEIKQGWFPVKPDWFCADGEKA